MKHIIRKTILSYVMLARSMLGQGEDVSHPSRPENSAMTATAPEDREAFLAQLQSTKTIRKRWSGEMVFLDSTQSGDSEQGKFTSELAAIANRLGIELPDMIVVKPQRDKHGRPKPQRPDAGVGWAMHKGQFRHAVFITENLRTALTDAEVLCALAHEMAHVPQYVSNEHRLGMGGKEAELAADRLALECPEVDPEAYKSMLIRNNRLNDATARRHSLLYGDILGSTAIIPASIQTKIALGGDHPMLSTRVALAEGERDRRKARAVSNAAGLIKPADERLSVTDQGESDPIGTPSSSSKSGNERPQERTTPPR